MSRNRKTAKEVLTIKLQIKRGLLASAAMAEKAPPVNTWSAVMPAYCYTSLCSEPALRSLPKKEKTQQKSGDFSPE